MNIILIVSDTFRREAGYITMHIFDVELPCSPEKLRNPEGVKEYLRNTRDRRYESDYFVAQTMIETADAWSATTGMVCACGLSLPEGAEARAGPLRRRGHYGGSLGGDAATEDRGYGLVE